MIQSLQQAGKADLLPLAYAFSALVFKQKCEQQWLKERFVVMRDILEESWAYQEMVKSGVAKGKKQGLEQGLQQGKKALEQVVVHYVELHFPDVVPLAKQQVVLATTPNQLQAILEKLFVARTDDEAKAVLLGTRPQM
jgi:predicted transposase YdaD